MSEDTITLSCVRWGNADIEDSCMLDLCRSVSIQEAPNAVMVGLGPAFFRLIADKFSAYADLVEKTA